MDQVGRAVIFVILSLMVLFGYQYLFPQAPAKKPTQNAEQQSTSTAPSASTAPADAAKDAPPVLSTSSTTPATQEPLSERVVTVENSLYKATFSTKGGTVKGWILKGFKDNAKRDIDLLRHSGRYPAMAVGSKGDYSISNSIFQLTGSDLTLDASRPTGTLTFFHEAQGVTIRRTYTFYHDSYRFDVHDEVAGLGAYEITLGGEFGLYDRKAEFLHVGPVLLVDTKKHDLDAGDLDAPQTFTESLKWIAIEDKYFFSGLVPKDKMASSKAWRDGDSNAVAFEAASGTGSYHFTAYAGPKERDRLMALNIGLEHIVDFGFFSPIALPIFWLMKKLYLFTHNYGWSIVLLTILIRLPFIPLVNKSQRSMKKLAELNPRMQEIREKYKKDPQRMNLEVMELYKKHKVNPVSGCLPLLLQIPVFFALYKVLLVAIELRGAPWAFWIVDLSGQDPYYVMPIIMGATMFIQQKITPSTMDPMQQKIMLFMPIIFTGVSLSFASGLVLYWMVNNLLSIAQQVVVNKQTEKEARSGA